MISIMKEKGIREIHITINEGKAAYVIDPVAAECTCDGGWIFARHDDGPADGPWPCPKCKSPENAKVEASDQ